MKSEVGSQTSEVRCCKSEEENYAFQALLTSGPGLQTSDISF